MERGLQTLSVQNFQILGNVTVVLGRLNVLVGPNGSGKSTLLQVVQFLGDAAHAGLSIAIARRGGVQSLWTRREKRGSIQISIRALLTTHAKITAPDAYSLTIQPLKRARAGTRRVNDRTERYGPFFHHSEQLSFKRTAKQDRRITLEHGEIHFDDLPGKVRPPRKSPPRDYHERDAIAIAQNIVADGLLASFDGVHRSTPHPSGSTRRTRSESFGHFRIKVLAISTAEDVEA